MSADVAFGSVKPAAGGELGGEFSGGGGRNLVSYGKGSKSTAPCSGT